MHIFTYRWYAESFSSPNTGTLLKAETKIFFTFPVRNIPSKSFLKWVSLIFSLQV